MSYCHHELLNGLRTDLKFSMIWLPFSSNIFSIRDLTWWLSVGDFGAGLDPICFEFSFLTASAKIDLRLGLLLLWFLFRISLATRALMKSFIAGSFSSMLISTMPCAVVQLTLVLAASSASSCYA